MRYRNRGVISLGRASPAVFGLRNKAGLLADGRRSRGLASTPRGYNSPRLLATFQIVLSRLRRAPPRASSSQLRALGNATDSTSDSILFVRHYSGPPSWFLLLPIVICLSSRGTLLLPDATVRSESIFTFGIATSDSTNTYALRAPFPFIGFIPRLLHPSVVIFSVPSSLEDNSAIDSFLVVAILAVLSEKLTVRS